jgi:hypothetical protein
LIFPWIFWIFFPLPRGRVQTPNIVQGRSLPKCETVETNLHSSCRFEHGWPSQTTFSYMWEGVQKDINE